jgi:hypothetical protein
MIRFETVLTAVQYFSWAKSGLPYMGVGRNLAYKEEFFNVNGFINHIQVRSGDDDLFINEAATATNTAIVYTPRALQSVNHIQSIASGLHKTYATAKHYKKRQATIRAFYCSQLLFLVLPIILLTFQFQWVLVLSLILWIFAWL